MSSESIVPGLWEKSSGGVTEILWHPKYPFHRAKGHAEILHVIIMEWADHSKQRRIARDIWGMAAGLLIPTVNQQEHERTLYTGRFDNSNYPPTSVAGGNTAIISHQFTQAHPLINTAIACVLSLSGLVFCIIFTPLGR